jgi:hypothetical protein
MGGMEEAAESKKALACNYAVATKSCRQNALCYVINPNPGWGGERVQLLARSRGGRWIQKWEVRWRLHNFRVKTVVPEQSIFNDIPDWPEWDSFDGARWNKWASEERGKRLEKFGPADYGQVVTIKA